MWLWLVLAATAALIADAQPMTTARDAVNSVQLTTEEEAFYVCPPPTGSTLLRLEPARKCPEEAAAKQWKEGIGVLFKENITPYKFKACVYYKNVIVTTTWSGTTYKQITNKFTDRTPVNVTEIKATIDTEGKCSSKATYLRNNVMVDAFDRDEAAKDVDLVPSKFSTNESKAWHTTNETYTSWGSSWIYKTGTSVNCIVECMDAKSAIPYDYFALANGDIVDSSPFYSMSPYTASTEHMGYAPDRYAQSVGYHPIDLDTKHRSSVPVTRNWITTTHYTVAWDWVPKTERACSMAKWKVVDEMLRGEYPGERYRFMASGLSATFISNTTEFDPDRIVLGHCVRAESEKAINDVFAKKYNGTHVKSGPIQYFLTIGGFVMAYQPVISRTLASMYIKELINDNRTDEALDLLSRQREAAGPTAAPGASPAPLAATGAPASLSRLRRAIATDTGLTEDTVIKTTSSAQFAMLQFVYDNIQKHINEMFSRLAAAWCELQNREVVLWSEGMKINPSAVATANLGRRVGARILGDVVAVSSCLTVEPSAVTLQNSMRSPTMPKTCYTRPLVFFSYEVDGEKIEGQLGENNELLLTTDMVEPCTANHRRYFLYGSSYALFEDYTFVRVVEPADFQLLSTFVELNVTLLEDREILPLTVYTKEELRDTGVLDYAEVTRRNHMHDLKFYDIDKIIEVDTNYAFMSGLADLFNGLGTAGKAIGKVIVGAAGAVVSTVSGIASFISNPFGGLAIGLLVIAAIVAAFLAYRYINKLRSNPMKTLYPITTKDLKTSENKSREDGEDELDEIDEEKLNQAREMVKYLTLLSAEERQKKKDAKRHKKGTTARLANHLTNLRLRNVGKRGGGYSRLDEDDMSEEDELNV